MDKYVDSLSALHFDLLHIAQSFATDNSSPTIEPAHILRALLHKSAGLVNYLEDTLDADYYYLVDWADMRMQQCEKSPYKMKGIVLSVDTQKVVKEAGSIAKAKGLDSLDEYSLLAALLTPGLAFSYEQLKTMPLTPDKIITKEGSINNANTKQTSKSMINISTSDSDMLCVDMLQSLPDLSVVGFDSEIRSLIEILARKDRANIIIVGETGVGKTSLVVGLLQMIKSQSVPSFLLDVNPYELDTIALCQGVTYKGEIEDRFKDVINRLANQVHPILVIENFHNLLDKQSLLYGVLPILRRALTKNDLQVICTTTLDGYTKDIEKDKELFSLFEKVTVEEPSVEMTEEVLKSRKDTYEQFHKIELGDDVPAEIVRLAKRYMSDKRLPSSALDLLDRSMAAMKVDIESTQNGENEVAQLNVDIVRKVVSKMTGIPMGNIQAAERERLSNAEAILHKRVVGQEHAVKSILDAVFESRSGLNKKGQPIGSFFFLGPTGTGKTELAKSLAEFLFNDESNILRFDMSEYKEEHSVALLYGAPPGYVGYEEGGLLVNQIRQNPYSVVLFDEIEKAHKSVFDLFLQILDEGKLHDRLGRIGDFSNALIIFTSNIGSDFIFNSFGQGHIPTHDQMLEVMQGQFRPEFLARLTEIVPFSPITTEMIDRIFDIHIKNLLKTLHEQKIILEIDESARKYVTSTGFNSHYGARPILGIIRKEIRRPLSKMIISGDIVPNSKVLMKYNSETKEIIWEITDSEECTK